MASDHNTSLTLSEDLQAKRHNHQAGSARQSGRRRASRANENKKKQPQRGMGVAKLESLRLQSQLFPKMTENNNKSSPSPPLPYTYIPSSFADHSTALNTVPMHFAAKLNGLGSIASGVGLNNLMPQQGILVQRVNGSNGSGLFHGQGLVLDQEKFQSYLYGVGNVKGNSKELSSTPKLVDCYTDHCADCLKKKRNISNGKSLVFHGVKDINGCDFVGLNLGSSQNHINGANQNFGKKATLHAGISAVGNTDLQGGVVEVVALHRKQGSQGVGNVLMEYEFFPGKGGRSGDCDNELMMMKFGSSGSDSISAVAAEASTTGGVVIDASISSSIDLSLRLSY